MLRQLFTFDSRRTFRPLRGHCTADGGGGGLRLHEVSLAQLRAGELLSAVAAPPGVPLNAWLAVHVVDFYNAASLLYGLVAEECSCPSMTAGVRFEYLWPLAAGAQPARLPARDYVDKLLAWVAALLDDPAVFPAAEGAPFPADFVETVRAIHRRIFRVYAHVLYHHLAAISAAGAEAHINTCLSHLAVFSTAHGLIEAKEMAPLQELIDRLAAARGGAAPPLQRAA